MMMFALSKINLLILVVALFTIIVYFTFSFQAVLVETLARQEAAKAMEQASGVIESSEQCFLNEVSVPEKLETASGQGYSFLMELRAVDTGDTNALIFSVISRDAFRTAVNKGKEPPIMASQRRDQHAAFHIFSIDEETGGLCHSSSALIGGGIKAIPIDTFTVMKETFQGVNNIYLVPCTSASKADCDDKLQDVACWIKNKRGSETRCTDTPEKPPVGKDPCEEIYDDMVKCSELK
ncbi:MAG: hypothetical protein NT067_06470 [Candidatus Diapherotrites archaeon]|nr:hypothetical protein [Candidatus Diapherotrites archaeon]